jgi:UV DNA damage endonuclease
MRYGLCCISLKLKEQGIGHQTMTFKRFNSLPREEALTILGERILNNMVATNEIIKYCAENGWCYRLSSDLMPLISYDKANVDLTDLPNHDEIQDAFDNIECTIKSTGVRISAHPDQFNVLASPNEKVVEKTITELNLMSSLMDRFGLSADHNTPINIHIQNSKDGTREEISHRFLKNFRRLDENCQQRLVVENDDRPAAWSVAKLLDIFHPITNIPITFDYLHHKCHPDMLDEETAIKACHDTWHGHKPLFHYSESREGNNPRAHADYAYNEFETYGLVFDLDMELKSKDLAIEKYNQIINGVLV